MGVGIRLLILVHHGKPEPQDDCYCLCFYSSAVFSSMNWLRWREPSLSYSTTPSHAAIGHGVVRVLQPLSQVCACILHPCKGILVGTRITRLSASTMPEAYTGIVFHQSGLRVFILFSSHLVIFSAWSSGLYSKLSNRPGPWALLFEPCFLSPVLAPLAGWYVNCAQALLTDELYYLFFFLLWKLRVLTWEMTSWVLTFWEFICRTRFGQILL